MTIKRNFFMSNGLIIVIIDRHPQLFLDFGGFSGDFVIDVDVPVDDLHLLTRQTN